VSASEDRQEFCYHPKGENADTVPPCLRTLDRMGRCPVHEDDVEVAW
jgi:hypothetical protein